MGHKSQSHEAEIKLCDPSRMKAGVVGCFSKKNILLGKFTQLKDCAGTSDKLTSGWGFQNEGKSLHPL